MKTLYTVYIAYTTTRKSAVMPTFEYYDSIIYPNLDDAKKRHKTLLEDFRKYATVLYSEIDEV